MSRMHMPIASTCVLPREWCAIGVGLLVLCKLEGNAEVNGTRGREYQYFWKCTCAS